MASKRYSVVDRLGPESMRAVCCQFTVCDKTPEANSLRWPNQFLRLSYVPRFFTPSIP